jgi:hypothetical protein
MIVKLVQLIAKLREARTVMIALQVASLGEIGALVLVSYAIAKAIDRIPGVDSGIRNLFTNSTKAIDGTKVHLRDLYAELNKTSGIQKAKIQLQIDQTEALSSLKKIQDEFPKKVPKWATVKLKLDPTVLAQIQTQINKLVNNLQPRPGTLDIVMPKAAIEARLSSMFPFLDSKTIDRMTSKAYKAIVHARSQFTEVSRKANFGPLPRSVAGQTSAALTDREFQQSALKAAQLQRAWNNAVTPQGYERGWMAYNNYVAHVTQEMTKNQKALFTDLINFIVSKTTLGATVSDAAILEMTRTASKLEDAFNRAPSIKNWRAWQKELNKINKVGTQNQITQATDILNADKSNQDKRVQAAKDAADKRKQIAKDEAAKVKQIQQDAAQKQKQLQDTATQNIKSSTSTVMGIYQDAVQQYQGYLGTIFQGPFSQSAIMQNRSQFGFGARPQDLVKDAKEAVGHAERFQSSLDKLHKRGAPSALVQQIAQLGPEAQAQLDVIGRMSDAQFKAWVGYFRRGQADAKAQAKKDLDSRLKEWLKFGKHVALAIAQGIKSEDVALENSMEALIRKIFPGLSSIAGNAPKPHKVQGVTGGRHMTVLPGAHPGLIQAGNIDLLHRKIAHIGKDIATVRSITVGFGKKFVLLPTILNGIAVSNKKAIENYRMTGKNLGTFSSETAADKYARSLHLQQEKYYSKTRNLQSAKETVQYNVYAAPGEGWETALRRAHFTQKNRKK